MVNYCARGICINKFILRSAPLGNSFLLTGITAIKTILLRSVIKIMLIGYLEESAHLQNIFLREVKKISVVVDLLVDFRSFLNGVCLSKF